MADESALKSYQRDNWNKWLKKYINRLESDLKDSLNGNLDAINEERRCMMDKSNPKYVEKNLHSKFKIYSNSCLKTID